MSASPDFAEVSREYFASAVLEKSGDVLVLADFWAAWCGPCQMLTPVLTKLAHAYSGKIFVAKINTDMEQDLALQYGIRSLPTVKFFRHGAVVDEFIGVQAYCPQS